MVDEVFGYFVDKIDVLKTYCMVIYIITEIWNDPYRDRDFANIAQL